MPKYNTQIMYGTSKSKQNKQNAGKRNAAADDTDIVSKLARLFTDRRNLATACVPVICFAIWGVIISSRFGRVEAYLDFDPKGWGAAYLDPFHIFE